MIYVITYRGVSRDGSGKDWKARAVAFVVGSLAAGAASGFALGWLGSTVPFQIRSAASAAFALVAAAIGLVELLGRRRVRVLQRNHETNRQWLYVSPVLGAMATGAVIGAGVFTRIGYWLWYVVPIGCWVVGSPMIGAAVFGTYAFTRAVVPALLAIRVAANERRGSGVDGHGVQDRMSNLTRPVAAVCTVQLLVLACASLVS
jgi:hypothetical protein